MKSKLKSLKAFLAELDLPNLQEVDYWDGDLSAIGLKNDKFLFYITTLGPKIGKNEVYITIEDISVADADGIGKEIYEGVLEKTLAISKIHQFQ